MISGKLVGLDPLDSEDLEILRHWRNNPNFRQYFREYREISKDMQTEWYKRTLNDKSTLMFSVRRLSDGALLGCCGLCYINWVNRNADLSLYIGYDDLYIDDIGYAEEATQLLLRYGFYELGLHKVWTEIYEIDTPKKALYEKLGLRIDGVLRDNYFHNGSYLNSFMFSILREDFDAQPWLAAMN